MAQPVVQGRKVSGWPLTVSGSAALAPVVIH